MNSTNSSQRIRTAAVETNLAVHQGARRLDRKELKRMFKERPVFHELRDLMGRINHIAFCLNYQDYEDSPAENRVTPEALWEYLSAVGEDQQERHQELQMAFDALGAFLAARPVKLQTTPSIP